MTTNASLSTLNAIFKTQFIDTLMKESVADKEARPFTALLRDSGSIQKNSLGRGASFPVVYDRPSTSGTFTTAQTNSAPAKVLEFNPTSIGHLFSPFNLDVDAIYRAMGDKAAYMGMAEFAVKQHTKGVADDLEQALFASGAGEIAEVANDATGTTIDLENDDDVWKFKVGDKLVFSETATGATLSSGEVTVTALDADGYLTVTPALSTVLTSNGILFDGYQIFRSGTQYGPLSANPLPTGLLAYATANTNLHGLNNTTHPRLTIPTVTGSLADPVGAIQSAQMLLQKMGPLGKATAVFVPWSVWIAISQQIDSDNRDKAGGLGEKGYNALRITGPQGPLDVLGSKYVQANTCWLIDPKTFVLAHVGPELVALEKVDGVNALKMRDAGDAVEGRVATRCQLLCQVPAANCRITLS